MAQIFVLMSVAWLIAPPPISTPSRNLGEPYPPMLNGRANATQPFCGHEYTLIGLFRATMEPGQ